MTRSRANLRYRASTAAVALSPFDLDPEVLAALGPLACAGMGVAARGAETDDVAPPCVAAVADGEGAVAEGTVAAEGTTRRAA